MSTKTRIATAWCAKCAGQTRVERSQVGRTWTDTWVCISPTCGFRMAASEGAHGRGGSEGCIR